MAYAHSLMSGLMWWANLGVFFFFAPLPFLSQCVAEIRPVSPVCCSFVVAGENLAPAPGARQVPVFEPLLRSCGAILTAHALG